MKFKVKSKKVKSKKQYKTKVKSKGNYGLAKLKQSVNMGLGFPKKLKVTLKYCEPVVFTSSIGAVQNCLFSMNGLYDPNITYTGHQPMYWDQYIGLYNHACVIGSKIRIQAVPYSTNAVPTNCVLWSNDDTTITPGSILGYAEQSKSKNYMLSDDAIPQTLTMSWSLSKTFGKNHVGDPTYASTLTSNPAEQTYAVFSIQAADLASTVTVAFNVWIEYVVIFYELRDINGS